MKKVFLLVILGTFLPILGLTLARTSTLAIVTPAHSCITISIPKGKDIFAPRVAVLPVGGCVTIHNNDGTVQRVQTTPHSPATFSQILQGIVGVTKTPGVEVTWKFTKPGLYHFYGSLHAKVTGFVQGNDVVVATKGARGDSDNPMQLFLVVMPVAKVKAASIQAVAGANLFTPKVVVLDAGGTVTFHNSDLYEHTVVTTPHSPAMLAKLLLGTQSAPMTKGESVSWKLSQPGLYHFYCSLHASVHGYEPAQKADIVRARSHFTGQNDQSNPMEVYVIVVQR